MREDGIEEDVYAEDSCILCRLNEAWGLGDVRFGREALDSRLSKLDEEEKAKIRIIGARMLRRGAGRRKRQPWRMMP